MFEKTKINEKEAVVGSFILKKVCSLYQLMSSLNMTHLDESARLWK